MKSWFTSDFKIKWTLIYNQHLFCSHVHHRRNWSLTARGKIKYTLIMARTHSRSLKKGCTWVFVCLFCGTFFGETKKHHQRLTVEKRPLQYVHTLCDVYQKQIEYNAARLSLYNSRLDFGSCFNFIPFVRES